MIPCCRLQLQISGCPNLTPFGPSQKDGPYTKTVRTTEPWLAHGGRLESRALQKPLAVQKKLCLNGRLEGGPYNNRALWQSRQFCHGRLSPSDLLG